MLRVQGEQNGNNKEQDWGKRTKMGPFRGVVFHKNTFLSSRLNQKEQNYFGHPQFYSTIAPTSRCDNILQCAAMDMDGTIG